MEKVITLPFNVLRGAELRIHWALTTFDKVCISLSGGKDSTVMLHLAATRARQLGRKIDVLFIDWEAQFQATIEHITYLKTTYEDVTGNFWWVALPLTTENAVSQFQPEWICWEPGIRWVRSPPEFAIREPTVFPFYTHAMSFEDFIPAFSEWYAGGVSAAMMVGIRTEESLNRFNTIASVRDSRYAPDKPWTCRGAGGNIWKIYPLYDWKVADIWTWHAHHPECRKNPLYNLMYQAGVPLKYMRVCEPFGPQQRQGLWLYHVLEPERWSALCQRVSGAGTGALYARETSAFYSRRSLNRPEGLTWKDYAMALLDSMPEKTAEHYKNKIAIYIRWYQDHGFPVDIPDEQEKDTGSKDIPSWRRICKVLLNNDYWCRALSFSPNTPRHYARYHQRIKKKREEWNILSN